MGRKPLSIDREIFLDRTHGGRMVTLLRDLGFAVTPIKEVYPNGKDQFIRDPDWIKMCGEKNWIIVSGDKKLETVPENRQAVIEPKARVFLLMDSESFPQEWAAALIVGHERIKDIIEANSGPFFVNISKRTGTHLARLRYPQGFGKSPKVDEESPEPEAPYEEPPVPVATGMPGGQNLPDLSLAKSGKLFN